MSVRKAAIWAMADQYVGFAIQFVASMVLARWFITPDELGIFSIAFASVSLLAFLQDFGAVRYVTGEKDLDEAKLNGALTLSMGLGWAIAALCLLMAWPLAEFYGDDRLVAITLLIAASYFFVPLAIVPQATRQREMDFRSTAIIGISTAMANAVVAITLGWYGYGALALAAGALAQQMMRALIAQIIVGGMFPWPPRLTNLRTQLDYGGTNTILVICLMVVARAPELLIGRLLGAAPVGLFARATGLAVQLRLLLAGAVSNVFYPAFARVRDRGEPLGPPYLRVVGAYTAITWPAMAGLAVLAEPTINLLYGPNWLETAPLLAWIAISQMCFITFPLNADIAILLHRKRELIWRNLADVVIAIALLVLAAPYGIEAVAASRLVHGILWMANFGPSLQRMLGFRWSELGAILLRTTVATLAAILPSLALFRFWAESADAGFLQLMASAALGILCWVFVLRQLRHPAYDEIAHAGSAILGRVGLARLVPAPR